ncbi:extracellular calcium-sensing receptor-like [Lissotriton helveticus]
MDELVAREITGKVWIASPSLMGSPLFFRQSLWNLLNGTIGPVIHARDIPLFKDFQYQKRPSASSGDIFIRPFWEHVFRCKWADSLTHLNATHNEHVGGTPACTGGEQLQTLQSSVYDGNNLRFSYTAYNAVYVFAHAVHRLLSCDPKRGECSPALDLQPWQEDLDCPGMASTNSNTDGTTVAPFQDIAHNKETWAQTSIPLIGYKEYTKQSERKSVYGRAKGGLAIYINTNIASETVEVYVDDRNMLVLKLEGWANNAKDPIILISLYINPKQKTASSRRMAAHLSQLKDSHNNSLVTGDFNLSLFHCPSEEHTDAVGPLPEQAMPLKTQGDKSGVELIKTCKLLGLLAQNGQKPSDIPPAWSSVWGNAVSIIDYTLVSRPLYNQVHDYSICHHVESDHNPQVIMVNTSLCKLELLHFVKTIHFMNPVGDELYFDEHGDSPHVVSIANWQLTPDGANRYAYVGVYDDRVPQDQKLTIHDDLVPHSVCSVNCPLGHREAAQEGKPVCCFDCILCSEGEIANTTGLKNCFKCPEDYWSNPQQDKCIKKHLEYLRFDEALGTGLAAIATVLTLITASVLIIFLRHKETPIVRANNRTISYLTLFSLILCFLCSFLFIGKPERRNCMLRQMVFGIVFSLCVSCILSKTTIVVLAFKAREPNSWYRSWLPVKIPSSIIFICIFLQVIVCATWLLISPPFLECNMKDSVDKILLQCNENSETAFYCMLGLLSLLACLSFAVAFKARKLPDRFNETKWITFSMMIFLSVWLSFLPAYLSTKGKYMVAVEIFAILSSSAGVLVCIFFPKCHIILLNPKLNNTQKSRVKK